MSPVPIPPILDRFIDLMTALDLQVDALKAWDGPPRGSADEALSILRELRTAARDARALIPELAEAGSNVDAVDARLQALDLTLDRYLGLIVDGRVEEAMSSKIGEHAAFLELVAEALRKKRDDGYASGRLVR